MIRFLVALTVALILRTDTWLARLLDRFPGPLWMVKTSDWGFRWGRQHRGTDYGSPRPGDPAVQVTGAPVIAPISGIVTNGNEPGGAGIYLWIAWGGVMFKAFHLQRHAVPSGTYVLAGTVIGYSNNTGSSTGAHNHWEIWLNGVNVDGEPYYEEARRAELNQPNPQPTPTPQPPKEEFDMTAAQDVNAHTDSEMQRLRSDLGIWEGQTRDIIVNALDDESDQIVGQVRSAVGFAGWASRPYLFGIHGEPAIYRKEWDPARGDVLVHVKNPAVVDGMDPTEVLALNLAWLEQTIETGYNPDVQWFFPSPTDEQRKYGHDRDPEIVRGLKALPGYVAP